MSDPLHPDDQAMVDDIAGKLSGYRQDRRFLIPILQMIQNDHAFLSPEAIRMVARYLDISTCEVYGVATFYNQFRLNPPGKHQIKVCLGTACHVKGGDIIIENFERKLGISAGETTPDREFSIEKVACVGCCALAPVAVVDEKVHGKVAPSKVEGLFLGFDIEREREKREMSAEEKAPESVQGNDETIEQDKP